MSGEEVVTSGEQGAMSGEEVDPVLRALGEIAVASNKPEWPNRVRSDGRLVILERIDQVMAISHGADVEVLRTKLVEMGAIAKDLAHGILETMTQMERVFKATERFGKFAHPDFPFETGVEWGSLTPEEQDRVAVETLERLLAENSEKYDRIISFLREQRR